MSMFWVGNTAHTAAARGRDGGGKGQSDTQRCHQLSERAPLEVFILYDTVLGTIILFLEKSFQQHSS